MLLALITFSFQHYNRAHLSDPIQPSPVVQELLEPTKLVGWDKVRQRSRASILKAEGVKVDTGQLVQVLAEEGTLGRGTTAEQLRSLTELIRLQTLKIDKLEEESRSMHEWREDMELLLPTRYSTAHLPTLSIWDGHSWSCSAGSRDCHELTHPDQPTKLTYPDYSTIMAVGVHCLSQQAQASAGSHEHARSISQSTHHLSHTKS